MFRSKDGWLYDTPQEVAAADARYEQTKLLREQNDFLQREREEKKEKEINDWMNELHNATRSLFCQFASEFGLGNPDAYYTRLFDLYITTEEANFFLSKLRISNVTDCKAKTIRNLYIIIEGLKTQIELHQRYVEVHPDEKKLIPSLQTLKEQIVKVMSLNKYVYVPLCIALVFYYVLFLLSLVVFKTPLGAILSVIGFLPFAFNISPKVSNSNIVKTINESIDEYQSVLDDLSCKINEKISNYEKKRLENFDCGFEETLYMISESYQERKEVLIKNNIPYKATPDFRLRFNPYPDEFYEFREKLHARQIERDGTDVFDDL